MVRALLIAVFFALAGCVQLPPNPQEMQSKKFESLPDKAVIYIVRNDGDSWETGSLLLDDAKPITVYRKTFYRWEVAPGKHRIAGFAGDASVTEVDAQAGRIYFIEYTVMGTRRSGWQYTLLRPVDDRRGRSLVMVSSLL